MIELSAEVAVLDESRSTTGYNKVFCLEYNLFEAYSMIRQKKNKFIVSGNHRYKGNR